MSSPRSVFPGAATRSTSPRAAANNGAFPLQISKGLCSSAWEHHPHGTGQPPALSSGNLTRSNKSSANSLSYHNPLLDSISGQTNNISFAPSLPILQDLALAMPKPVTRLAGRTALHLPAWEKRTSNQWTLQAVSGYGLEFKDQPQQSHRPQTMESRYQAKAISEEIQKLEEKGAIQEINNDKDGFYSRLFLVPKKDGQMRPCSDQPPISEPISGSQPFQDVGHARSEGSPTKERLDDKNRSQGCLLLDPHPPRAPEVATIQVGKEIVSVHMSSFKTSLSSESVHEDPSASGGVFTQQRHSPCHLSGRHSPSGSGQGQADGTHSDNVVTPRSLRLSSELPQVSPGTLTEADLPRLHNRFSKEGAEPPAREDGGNNQGSQSDPEASANFCSLSSPANWEDVGSASGNSTYPTPLSEFTESQAHSFEEEGSRPPNRTITSSTQGPRTVDTKSVRMEWPSSPDARSNPGNRGRCIEERMGGILWGIMTGGCWNTQEAELHINSLEMMAAFFAIKAFAKDCCQTSIKDNISVVAHVNKIYNIGEFLIWRPLPMEHQLYYCSVPPRISTHYCHGIQPSLRCVNICI